MNVIEVMLLVCIVGLVLVCVFAVRAIVSLKTVNGELVEQLCAQNHRLSELLESASESLREGTEHGALVLRDKMRYEIDLARARAFGDRPVTVPADPADAGSGRAEPGVDRWSDTANNND